jgi:phosphoglucomutase
MTDLTTTTQDLKNHIAELLNSLFDKDDIFAWREVGKDIVVDLMNGNTLTIAFKTYPEAR